MPLMDGCMDDGSQELEKLIEDMLTITDRALGDIGRSSATKQMLLGAASGWVTGFMVKQIWKIAGMGIGTGVIALHIANQNGYININWDAINKKMDNFAKKLGKKATGKSPAWTDKEINNIASVSRNFIIGIAECQPFIKAIPFILKSFEIYTLMDKFSKPVVGPNMTTERDAFVLIKYKHIAFAKWLLRICMFISALGFVASVAFSDPPFEDLPLSSMYKIDNSKSPDYQIAFVYQIVACTVAVLTYVSTNVIVIGLMYLTVGELQTLKYDLRQIDADGNPDNQREDKSVTELVKGGNLKNKGENRAYTRKFIKCIEHHQEIRSLIKNQEDLFYPSLLALILLGTLNLAVCFFILSINPDIGLFLACSVYICTLLADLLLFCYLGNQIQLEDESIIETVYSICWRKRIHDKEFVQDILIMLTALQRPITVGAGKIVPLSLKTFMSIIKTSYSYFALLRQLQAKKKLTTFATSNYNCNNNIFK